MVGYSQKIPIFVSPNQFIIKNQIMFGNLEEKQKEMQEKLAQIELDAEAGGGVVKVKINAARQILDVTIDPEFKYDDVEELEDLILTAVNRAIAAAAVKEQEESQKMIKDMMPPGLGGLGDMFGM
jgi:DNA-binding YbaB/EbfC family protein